MPKHATVKVAIALAFGLFVVSAFLSNASFASTPNSPLLSKVPVYLSIKPGTVTHTQKVTLTGTNPTPTTYTFIKACDIEEINGHTMSVCEPKNVVAKPGSESASFTFECSKGETGSYTVWLVNTAAGYESHSATLDIRC